MFLNRMRFTNVTEQCKVRCCVIVLCTQLKTESILEDQLDEAPALDPIRSKENQRF